MVVVCACCSRACSVVVVVCARDFLMLVVRVCCSRACSVRDFLILVVRGAVLALVVCASSWCYHHGDAHVLFSCCTRGMCVLLSCSWCVRPHGVVVAVL